MSRGRLLCVIKAAARPEMGDGRWKMGECGDWQKNGGQKKGEGSGGAVVLKYAAVERGGVGVCRDGGGKERGRAGKRVVRGDERPVRVDARRVRVD